MSRRLLAALGGMALMVSIAACGGSTQATGSPATSSVPTSTDATTVETTSTETTTDSSPTTSAEVPLDARAVALGADTLSGSSPDLFGPFLITGAKGVADFVARYQGFQGPLIKDTDAAMEALAAGDALVGGILHVGCFPAGGAELHATDDGITLVATGLDPQEGQVECYVPVTTVVLLATSAAEVGALPTQLPTPTESTPTTTDQTTTESTTSEDPPVPCGDTPAPAATPAPAVPTLPSAQPTLDQPAAQDDQLAQPRPTVLLETTEPYEPPAPGCGPPTNPPAAPSTDS